MDSSRTDAKGKARVTAYLAPEVRDQLRRIAYENDEPLTAAISRVIGEGFRAREGSGFTEVFRVRGERTLVYSVGDYLHPEDFRASLEDGSQSVWFVAESPDECEMLSTALRNCADALDRRRTP